MSESQTPRTDAAERDQEDRAEYRGYLVPARFARELETELTATRARLAKIEEAARADEADLEKMRDGTKLTRAGVVMALQFLQDENEEFRARLAELEGIAERPRRVCLCGSSRWPDEHHRVMMEETLAGRIVIPMGLYGHADYPIGAKAATNDGDEATEVKQMLDRLHFAKIDLADEILVVNVGGYIGSSTAREIEYAKQKGKTVRFLEAYKEGKK